MAIIMMSIADAAAAQVKTIPCPKGVNSFYQCVASTEVCGWRYSRPTDDEIRSAERGELTLIAACPTLPSGQEMQHCAIDRTEYCKAPSARDIAKAAAEAKAREERARQQKLQQEQHAAEVAKEIQLLGGHRADEARRLVEMREAAERARSGGIAGISAGPFGQSGNGPPLSPQKCTTKSVSGRIVACGIGHVDCDVNFESSETAARSSVVKAAARYCQSATGDSVHSLDSIRCEVKADLVAGKLYRCAGRYTCNSPKKVCEGGGSSSAQ